MMNPPKYISVSVCCKECKEIKVVQNINFQKYKDWQNGELIQRAFPDHSPADRELLKSAICGTCWDAMFAPLEEDQMDAEENAKP